MEYNDEEQRFVTFWREERLKGKRNLRHLLVGLPLGIVIVVAVLINFFSGWYKRATMEANADPSIFIILLIAGILIVAFAVIFSSYHRWDINETRYRELLAREENHDI